jgi:hypothetical protein
MVMWNHLEAAMLLIGCWNLASGMVKQRCTAVHNGSALQDAREKHEGSMRTNNLLGADIKEIVARWHLF